MKKIVVLSLLCLFSITTMAQSLPITLGVHAGWNASKAGVKMHKMSARSGYMVGAFARVDAWKLYIEPALNYSYKECKAENGTLMGQDAKLEYATIDIPVMVGINVFKAPMFKLRTFAGPVASFLAKDIELKKEVKDTDKMMWNGKIGVGVDIWKATFDMDYEFGVKKFGDGVKAPNTFNLTIGFKII